MASGSFAVASSNKYVSPTVNWSSEKNSDGNYSLVDVELRASRTNSGYTTAGSGSGYFIVNGTKYPFTITVDQAIKQNSNTLLGSVTDVKIPHNENGEKQITIEVYATIPVAGLTLGTTSKTVTLDTIPRASQPSLITWPDTTKDVGDIGSTITVHMNKKANFTHTVRYVWGNQSGVIAENVENNCQWTIPESFIEEIPNASSGIGSVYVDTYNGTTLIGTKSVGFSASVPSNIIPLITSIEVSEYIAGVMEKFGQFLQNVSRLNIVTKAEGVYGSTIKSYSIKVLDINYSGENVITNVLTKSGSITIEATAKDSRERTATLKKTVSVGEYISPTITSFSIIRSDSEGNEKNLGTYALANINFNITPIDGLNDKSYVLEYRQTDSEEWATIQTGSVYEMNGTILSGEILSKDYSYVFRLTITDYFKPVLAEATVNRSIPVYNIKANKKGLAFFMKSEKDGLEIDGEVWFYKDVFVKVNGEDVRLLDLFGDYIVEQGISGIWTYRKWNSGIAECWGTTEESSIDITTAWGNIYVADDAVESVPYPFEFASIPQVQFSPNMRGLNYWFYTNHDGNTLESPSLGVARGTSKSGASVSADFHVIGRWKEQEV